MEESSPEDIEKRFQQSINYCYNCGQVVDTEGSFVECIDECGVKFSIQIEKTMESSEETYLETEAVTSNKEDGQEGQVNTVVNKSDLLDDALSNNEILEINKPSDDQKNDENGSTETKEDEEFHDDPEMTTEKQNPDSMTTTEINKANDGEPNDENGSIETKGDEEFHEDPEMTPEKQNSDSTTTTEMNKPNDGEPNGSIETKGDEEFHEDPEITTEKQNPDSTTTTEMNKPNDLSLIHI